MMADGGFDRMAEIDAMHRAENGCDHVGRWRRRALLPSRGAAR